MSSDTIQLTIPGALVSVQAAQEPGTLIADRSGWQRAVLRAALPSAAKLVACTLASHVAEAPPTIPDGAAVTGPGLVTLMEQTGYSRTHVQRQVSRLRRQGWLTTVARPSAGRTTRFALAIPDAAVRAGLVRLVELAQTVPSAAGAESGTARRRGRRARAGSHTKSTARRRSTRAKATAGSAASASGGSHGTASADHGGSGQGGSGGHGGEGGFVVDLVPSRRSQGWGDQTQPTPGDPPPPDDWIAPDDRVTVPTPSHPATPTDAEPAHLGEPQPVAPTPPAPTPPAPVQPAPVQPEPVQPVAAAGAEDVTEARGAEAGGEDALDPTAPTIPLPPKPPAPMVLAATQVINVLANAMRRPTSDFLEIFGKLQVIFDGDDWDPVTLALHLAHIIGTGVLVGDGDEIDNLSWRLDRLPRSSAECECRSCLERRGEMQNAPPAPGTRRFVRSGTGRSAAAARTTDGGGTEAGASISRANVDLTEPRPVEIPRPPLEAIERAALAAREARLRERAAGGAA